MRKLFLLTVLATFAACGQSGIQAADNDTEGSAESPKRTEKPRQMPFRGTVVGVDKDAMTITLKGREKDRIFHIRPQTKIARSGKPLTLDAVVVGNVVGGLARENAGRWEVVTLNVGTKTDDVSEEEAESGQQK